MIRTVGRWSFYSMYPAEIAGSFGCWGLSRTISQKVKLMAAAQILREMKYAKVFPIV